MFTCTLNTRCTYRHKMHNLSQFTGGVNGPEEATVTRCLVSSSHTQCQGCNRNNKLARVCIAVGAKVVTKTVSLLRSMLQCLAGAGGQSDGIKQLELAGRPQALTNQAQCACRSKTIKQALRKTFAPELGDTGMRAGSSDHRNDPGVRHTLLLAR